MNMPSLTRAPSRNRPAATPRYARNRFEIAMGSFALLYLLLFSGVPLVYNVVLSFQQVDLMSPAFFVRPFVGLTNYLDVLSRPESLRVLINTIVFVAVSLVFQISIGLLLALLFLQRFPAASFLRGLFLAGWIMPGLVTGAIWKLIFAGDFGVLNHALISTGLVHAKLFWLSDPRFALSAVILANVWLGVPFNMLLLSVGLIGIPEDIYEAAKIDGAGPIRRFISMTLPMMRSTLGAVVSLGAIMTMQQFDLIAALTQGGPANASEVAQYWSWQLSFQTFEVAQGSAVATIMLVLVLSIAVVYVRSIRHEHIA